jgi:hypothetical protein
MILFPIQSSGFVVLWESPEDKANSWKTQLVA